MANGDVLLQAALNGDRDHPAAPRTPDELAAEARAAVDAGARTRSLYEGPGRKPSPRPMRSTLSHPTIKAHQVSQKKREQYDG